MALMGRRSYFCDAATRILNQHLEDRMSARRECPIRQQCLEALRNLDEEFYPRTADIEAKNWIKNNKASASRSSRQSNNDNDALNVVEAASGIPSCKFVLISRKRKVSPLRFKSELAKELLERDGIPYSNIAANRYAEEAKQLILNDTVIAERAAKWAEERNKPSLHTRKRAVKLLKKNLLQVQQEMAQLGLTVVSYGVDMGKGFEIKAGPLVSAFDKFIGCKGIKIKMKSILEAVSLQSSIQLIARCTDFVTREVLNNQRNSENRLR